MSEKHSAVCYIFREGAFTPVQEAKPLRNEFNLDLFQYKGAVYEGKPVCVSVRYRTQSIFHFLSGATAG